MANPQKEKGYTSVANEILEHIMKTNLNGTQFRIVLAVWRYTYGFRRTAHELSTTFIAKLIDGSRSQVERELKILIARKIINVIDTGPKGGRVMGVNKNYDEYVEQGGSKRPSGLIAKQEPDNQQPKKEKKKPDKAVKYPEGSSYYKMAIYFHERVAAVAKEAGVEHLTKKANLQSWADDFRKLVEIDGVSKKLAKDVMDWVVEDSFWRTNVLSAKKLREKFTDLAIKMNAVKKPQPAKPRVSDARDKDIEFQKWIAAGNDPNDFNWV